MANDTNFILDLSNYKDRVGARVDPGRYTVIVDDAEMDKSKAGNPMINVWLRIIGGEFDGATLTDRLTITDKALFRVVGFMQAIGMKTPKKRLQVNLRHFIGQTLMVDVEDGEPYNGRIKSEVRGYARVTKGEQGGGAEDVADLPSPEDDGPSPAEEAAEPVAEAAPAPTPAPSPATAEAPEEVDLETLDL